MKKTWVEVLLELPVDAGLRDFLTDNGLTMPAGFTWTDAPETSHALVEALLTCTDVTVRDRVTWPRRNSMRSGFGRSCGWPWTSIAGTGSSISVPAFGTWVRRDVIQFCWRAA